MGKPITVTPCTQPVYPFCSRAGRVHFPSSGGRGGKCCICLRPPEEELSSGTGTRSAVWPPPPLGPPYGPSHSPAVGSWGGAEANMRPMHSYSPPLCAVWRGSRCPARQVHRGFGRFVSAPEASFWPWNLDRLGIGWQVPREQKILKENPPSVMYHQVYLYTKKNFCELSRERLERARGGERERGVCVCVRKKERENALER